MQFFGSSAAIISHRLHGTVKGSELGIYLLAHAPWICAKGPVQGAPSWELGVRMCRARSRWPPSQLAEHSPHWPQGLKSQGRSGSGPHSTGGMPLTSSRNSVHKQKRRKWRKKEKRNGNFPPPGKGLQAVTSSSAEKPIIDTRRRTPSKLAAALATAPQDLPWPLANWRMRRWRSSHADAACGRSPAAVELKGSRKETCSRI